MPLPEILTLDDAASFAQVSKATLKKIILAGRLKAVDVGTGNRHHYRISKQDLLRFCGISDPQNPLNAGQVHSSDRAR
jgi:excisionase family DNA binding protein